MTLHCACSHLLVLLVALCMGLPLAAQEEERYTKEWGAALGTGFMLNDANSRLYGQSHLAGGLLLRFVPNTRMAFKLALSHQRIRGSVARTSNFYPALPHQASTERLSYAFSSGLTDLSALYELHFLPYGYHRSYLNNHRLVPYLQMGLGIVYSHVGQRAALHFPLGFGLKYKLRPRLNLGLEWRMHLSGSDRLEGLEGPTGTKSELMRNADHFGQTLLTLTYDFSPTCPACNKAD